MTQCPDDAKTVGHQNCRKQNQLLWMKHEKLSSHHWPLVLEQLLCVVSDHESAFSPARKQAKHYALWLCTIHGCLLQPKCGSPVVRMHLSIHLCLLHWAEAWILRKNSGKGDHQNHYFNWTKVLMRVGTNRSFGILIGLHLCITDLKYSFVSVWM